MMKEAGGWKGEAMITSNHIDDKNNFQPPAFKTQKLKNFTLSYFYCF